MAFTNRKKAAPPEEPAPTAERLFVARSSGVIRLNGVVRRYARGKTIVPESDPLRAAMPWRFAPLEANPRPVALALEPEPVALTEASASGSGQTGDAGQAASDATSDAGQTGDADEPHTAGTPDGQADGEDAGTAGDEA